MDINRIICEQTGDSCNYIKHSSGLEIFVCEMEGFSTTEALFELNMVLLIHALKRMLTRNLRQYRRVSPIF